MGDYQTKACQAVLKSIKGLVAEGLLLPKHVVDEVNLALATFDDRGMPDISPVVGDNWVIARRTSRVVSQYGAEVVALSAAGYHNAQISAYAKRLGVSPSFVAARLA